MDFSDFQDLENMEKSYNRRMIFDTEERERKPIIIYDKEIFREETETKKKPIIIYDKEVYEKPFKVVDEEDTEEDGPNKRIKTKEDIKSKVKNENNNIVSGEKRIDQNIEIESRDYYSGKEKAIWRDFVSENNLKKDKNKWIPLSK